MVSKRVESLLNQLRTQGIVDERVLEAITLVPREKFVDEAFEHKAWENTALPIGQGQTISQCRRYAHRCLAAGRRRSAHRTGSRRYAWSDRNDGADAC